MDTIMALALVIYFTALWLYICILWTTADRLVILAAIKKVFDLDILVGRDWERRLDDFKDVSYLEHLIHRMLFLDPFQIYSTEIQKLMDKHHD